MAHATILAVVAVGYNAMAWGLSWWPFRALSDLGLHPLWATSLIYMLAVAVLSVARPGAWAPGLRHPGLWGLCAAAGLTNLAFNWGIASGDVVRVVLCFYLMPMWSLLLAWGWLGERPSQSAFAQLGLAMAGVGLVLWPGGDLLAKPLGLPEALGVLGGLSFAFTNLLLRRHRELPSDARSLSMFVGGAAFSGVLAAILGASGVVAWPPAPTWHWLLGLLALAFFYLAANLTLQYGAARLPSRVTALVLITEVVWATASSVALGASTMSLRLLLGGALILGAACLASLSAHDAP